MVNIFPFAEVEISDEKNKSVTTRIFGENISPSELLWHWDEEDRLITPKNPSDWKFQFDNQLPVEIKECIFIPKGVWHRLLKGTGDLILTVEKIRYINHEKN